MKRNTDSEKGQAVVEFAIILIALLMMTVGLVDVGRGFYQYNALSALARYGARWGAVVGGTCVGQPNDNPSSDWCNQYNSATQVTGTTGSMNFWNEYGNYPLQGAGTACPSSWDTATTSNSYIVGNYSGSDDTSIVGTIKQRYDTNSGSNTVSQGGLSPGFDLSRLKVCIYLTQDSAGQALVYPGSTVKVYVYYKFQPVSALITKQALSFNASSEYVIQ